MKHYLVIALLFVVLVTFESCKDDDAAPTITIEAPTIDHARYTGGGTLKVLYSTDGGTTYQETLEKAPQGSKVHVKLNDGTNDLSSDDFTTDWTGSSVHVSNFASGVTEFTVPANTLTLKVKVSDVLALVTSHRSSGKFYSLNTATGEKTEIFTATYNSATMNEIRAFVYHPNQKLYYASENTNKGGRLYSINPTTKVATLINGNTGNGGQYDVWDAIVNWAVAADDSLISVGDFNDDGNGIVKFGTNGGRSLKTTEVNICCGLGMAFDASTSQLTVGNSWYTGDGEIDIETITSAGTVVSTKTFTKFTGFPNNFSTDWLTMKGLARDYSGNLYGLLFPYDLKKTFFVKIDVSNSTIFFISTLGADDANQYNTLTFIPKHLL